jgi:hypothetical protein
MNRENQEHLMKPDVNKDRVAKALLDPSSVFSTPMDVVEDKIVTAELKIEILRRWEYDAREMQVADEEGFPARPPGCLLDAVITALHRMGTGTDIEHSPPTKQGGV